jgi:chromosomal replication initiator protein
MGRTSREKQVTNGAELWTGCSEILRKQVSDATWMTWFSGLTPVEVDDDTLVLATPSSLVRERLEGRFLGLLEDALSEAAAEEMHVRLIVRVGDAEPFVAPASRYDPDPEVEAVAPRGARPGWRGQTGSGAGRANQSNGAGTPRAEPALNPRYTFDAFVIGASNRFAHAAAQRVAEVPAASYNPLFIHGDSGLGKTHLLHAIGHYVAENFPSLHIRYVSTETFMNEFVDAIRTNGQSSFKRRYRDCDVLLVDDIQFMEGKEGLQEEFFHTFNSLYDASKQIVLSSDRPPRSIATLEDRLRSRFESGLITDVQPPELETRLAILRKKAESERTPIPNEVLELIATHVRDNIRELEGALIRVSAFASLNGHPITLERSQEVLSDLLDAGRPRQITPKVILDATASTFGFSVDELCGPSRRRPLVTARQIGMYVFRELTEFSYPAIAREFGGRDHTTVIHAVEKISGLMRERRQVYDTVTELIHQIRGGQ